MIDKPYWQYALDELLKPESIAKLSREALKEEPNKSES